MDSKDWVIIWLSLQLFVLSLMFTQSQYKLGYEKGRASVFADMASDPTDGTPYTGGSHVKTKK